MRLLHILDLSSGPWLFQAPLFLGTGDKAQRAIRVELVWREVAIDRLRVDHCACNNVGGIENCGIQEFLGGFDVEHQGFGPIVGGATCQLVGWGIWAKLVYFVLQLLSGHSFLKLCILLPILAGNILITVDCGNCYILTIAAYVNLFKVEIEIVGIVVGEWDVW